MDNFFLEHEEKSKMLKIERRAVIKPLTKEGNSQSQIKQRTLPVFGTPVFQILL